MKKSLFLLMLAVVLLSSCVTQKRCHQKYPPIAETIVKDSIVTKDSIVEKIVEVPVEIKGDTVIKTETVYKDKVTGLMNSKPVYTETAFAKVTAKVTNGKLTVELIQKDTLFKVQTVARESYFWKEKYFKEKSKTVDKVKIVPKYYTVMSIIGLVYITITIAYIIFKLRSKLNFVWPR